MSIFLYAMKKEGAWRAARWSLDFDILYPIGQDQIDELVPGIVAFAGDAVEFTQDLFPDTHGDDAVAVLAFSFDFQWFILHFLHLAILW